MTLCPPCSRSPRSMDAKPSYFPYMAPVQCFPNFSDSINLFKGAQGECNKKCTWFWSRVLRLAHTCVYQFSKWKIRNGCFRHPNWQLHAAENYDLYNFFQKKARLYASTSWDGSCQFVCTLHIYVQIQRTELAVMTPSSCINNQLLPSLIQPDLLQVEMFILLAGTKSWDYKDQIN